MAFGEEEDEDEDEDEEEEEERRSKEQVPMSVRERNKSRHPCGTNSGRVNRLRSAGKRLGSCQTAVQGTDGTEQSERVGRSSQQCATESLHVQMDLINE